MRRLHLDGAGASGSKEAKAALIMAVAATCSVCCLSTSRMKARVPAFSSVQALLRCSPPQWWHGSCLLLSHVPPLYSAQSYSPLDLLSRSSSLLLLIAQIEEQ